MNLIRQSKASEEPGKNRITEAGTTGGAMLWNGHRNTPFPVRPSSRARRRVRRVLPRPKVLRAVVTGRSYTLPRHPLQGRSELGPITQKAHRVKQLTRPTRSKASSESRLDGSVGRTIGGRLDQGLRRRTLLAHRVDSGLVKRAATEG